MSASFRCRLGILAPFALATKLLAIESDSYMASGAWSNCFNHSSLRRSVTPSRSGPASVPPCPMLWQIMQPLVAYNDMPRRASPGVTVILLSCAWTTLPLRNNAAAVKPHTTKVEARAMDDRSPDCEMRSGVSNATSNTIPVQAGPTLQHETGGPLAAVTRQPPKLP